MGLLKIFLGFVFLANPCISLLDFLPDFIGFLLIREGLFKFDYIDSHLSEARDVFHKLYLYGWAKFLFMFVIPGADDNTRLLISFACCVVEILLFWSAIPHLFDGFASLATRYNAKNFFTHYSSARFLTYTFVVVKNILILLPDVFTIFILDAEMQGVSNLQYQLMQARMLSMPITMVATALFGGYTLYHLYLFLRDVNKDKVFIAALKEKYKEVFLDNENLQARRSMRLFTRYFGYAFICLINFYIDGYSAIPDFLSLPFLLLAFRYLHRLVPLQKSEVWLLSGATLLSVASWGYRFYMVNALTYFQWNFSSQPFAFPFAIVSLALPALAYFFVLKRLRALCKMYTVYTFEPESMSIWIGFSVFCIASIVQYALPQYLLPWGWIGLIYCGIFVFRANAVMQTVYREARLKLLL